MNAFCGLNRELSAWISHIINVYANRATVVHPQYQQKPLWYSKQTFVSLLCCQRRDNEATGTNSAKPRLSCSPKTFLITTWCKASHLVKRLSQPITTKSIASVMTMIWGQHELFVYSLTTVRQTFRLHMVPFTCKLPYLIRFLWALWFNFFI